MDREYKIDKKNIIMPLIIFLIISIAITFFCLNNILENKKAIDEFTYNEEGFSLTPEMAELFKKNMQEELERKYSISILICVLASLGEIYFFVTYFLQNTKIIINEKGISIYHIYKKKTAEHYNWDQIKSLSFGYGKCDKGLLGQYVMEIKIIKNEDDYRSNYIPIQKLKNYNHMLDELKNSYPHMSMNKMWNISEEKSSLKETAINAYREYKKNIASYMIYSIIIFIFNLLVIRINVMPANIIALIAYIYFAFRAEIGMNYMAFQSYKGDNINFEAGWQYGNGRVEKYFEAKVVMVLIYLVVVIGEAVLILSSVSNEIKWIGSFVMALILFVVMTRIYLITYVNSIIGIKESYISLTNEILKNNYKKVASILGVLSIGLIPALIHGIKAWPDMYKIEQFKYVLNYIYLFINLFLKPLLSCIMMKIISDSYEENRGEVNG